MPQPLSDFLSTLSSAADADAVAREGVVYAAAALAADVAVVLRGTHVVARAGRAAREMRSADLIPALEEGHEHVRLRGIGLSAMAVSPLQTGSGIRLVAVRDRRRPFSREERDLLADMASALALVWGVDPGDVFDQPDHVLDESAPDEAGAAQRALRNSEHRLRELVQGAPTPFVAVDEEGLVLEWNTEAEAIFGWPRSEAVGRRFVDHMIAPGRRDAFTAEVEAFAAAADSAPHRVLETYALRRDGLEVPVELKLSRLRAGRTYIIQTFVRDLSESVRAERERREAQARIAHMALHDALTGLPNRTLLFDRLAHALAGARRRATTLAVLYIDVDNFRMVNESLGHNAGDELLIEVARRLADIVRRSDTMARVREDTLVRFGGDEFVLVCEDIAGERDATRIANRLTGALAGGIVVAGEQVVTSASIGIALATVDSTPDAVINEAEAAMHRAKQAGRARYEVFDPSKGPHVRNRLQEEAELRQAIEHDELRLFYQPIVSVSDGGLVGAEALVRWEHPERGLLAPGQFLPLAEETGMIVPLGRWVLREACTRAAGWQRRGLFMRIAVNVSGHQLADGELGTLVTEVLEESELDASRLVLEITESVLVQESKISVDLLRELRGLGVRVSLDDFGTGYSSLSYLRRLPLDAVKLDRAFISGLADTTVDRQIVAAIVQMARALSMTVVAEGVETAAQWDSLRELGCHLAQGYYFARPMPAAQMSSVVEDASSQGGLLPVSRNARPAQGTTGR